MAEFFSFCEKFEAEKNALVQFKMDGRLHRDKRNS